MARILVSDEEEILCRALDRFLSGLGHEVSTAPEGRELLAKLDSARPDVVITDVHMRRVGGAKIVDALTPRGKAVAMIAMSGRGGLENEALGHASGLIGAVVSLTKPFSLDELRVALDAVLAVG